MRGLGWAFAVILACHAAAAFGQPPLGRYRCYQPPSYSVMAWFDLTAAGIAVNGEEALPIRVEAGGRIELPPEAIPPWRLGWHLGSGAKDRDAERVTIVLARDVRQVPGSRAWQRLPRCYLTTH